MISIIVPTKDEELLLPKLLRSIEKQTYKDYEVIIADADSKDNTICVAEQYGCKIVKGGTFSEGRNNGAKFAKGNILLFVDADMEFVNKHFLFRVNNAFKDKKVVGATCKIRISKYEETLFDKIFFSMTDLMIETMNTIGFGTARGGCQAVRKEKFTPYNEKIELGEDIEFFRRLAKKGKTLFLHDIMMYESKRRYKKQGYIKVLIDWVNSGIDNFILRKNCNIKRIDVR
jgi:glycosyltransferase involved in cell wall biosynthesis